MRHKWLLWMMALLLCLAPAMAQDGCVTHQTCTWWATTSNADTVNISIWYPNGSVAVSNASMVRIEPGIWSYNDTFTISGNYFSQAIFYDNANQVSVASESKDIYTGVERSMTSIATIFGLLAIIGFLMYSAKHVMNRPKTDENKAIHKLINGVNLGVFLYIIASWFVVALSAVLAVLAKSSAYAAIMDGIYLGTLSVVGVFNLAYIFMFIVFMIQKRLERINDVMRR